MSDWSSDGCSSDLNRRRAVCSRRDALRSLGGSALGVPQRSARPGLLDLLLAVAEDIAQDLLGVLAEQRRALHVGRRVRQLDRVADGQVLAALRMVDLDDGAGRAQARLLGQLLHGEDRAAGDVQRVAGRHDLELRLGLGPFLDGVEALRDLVRSEEHTSELQSLMSIPY